MITIFNCEQNSPEWMACRLGIPTASAFSKILAKGEGKTRKRYLLDLAAERITGEMAESYSNSHMERGHAMEAEARNMYAFRMDQDPVRVGFIRRDAERAGASPDSLVGDDGLLEIKTKLGALQLEVLEQKRLPSEHVAQVQGQLWVSGRAFCDFVSYWPKLPLFVTRVARDEAYIASLAQAVADFNGELDSLVKRYSQ
jgi:predicted phage-related endonuclease